MKQVVEYKLFRESWDKFSEKGYGPSGFGVDLTDELIEVNVKLPIAKDGEKVYHFGTHINFITDTKEDLKNIKDLLGNTHWTLDDDVLKGYMLESEYKEYGKFGCLDMMLKELYSIASEVRDTNKFK